MSAGGSGRRWSPFRPRPLAVGVIVATFLALPRIGVAQRVAGLPPPTIEVRGDLIASHSTTLHAGVAALWSVSPYLRVGGLAASGVTSGVAVRGGADDGERVSRWSGRGEVIARFTPDPRTGGVRWRPYGQLSLGVLGVRGGGRGRALVAAGVGVEHSPLGSLGVRPALEVGLGGGLRAALLLRAPLP